MADGVRCFFILRVVHQVHRLKKKSCFYENSSWGNNYTVPNNLLKQLCAPRYLIRVFFSWIVNEHKQQKAKVKPVINQCRKNSCWERDVSETRRIEICIQSLCIQCVSNAEAHYAVSSWTDSGAALQTLSVGEGETHRSRSVVGFWWDQCAWNKNRRKPKLKKREKKKHLLWRDSSKKKSRCCSQG